MTIESKTYITCNGCGNYGPADTGWDNRLELRALDLRVRVLDDAPPDSAIYLEYEYPDVADIKHFCNEECMFQWFKSELRNHLVYRQEGHGGRWVDVKNEDCPNYPHPYGGIGWRPSQLINYHQHREQ